MSYTFTCDRCERVFTAAQIRDLEGDTGYMISEPVSLKDVLFCKLCFDYAEAVLVAAKDKYLSDVRTWLKDWMTK